MTHDIVWWLYLLIAIFSWYGFGLFGWWWLKLRHATRPYMYVTFTYLGLGIYSSGDIFARSLRFANAQQYYDFMGSTIWTLRPIIVLLAVVVMVSHMSYRAFYLRPREEFPETPIMRANHAIRHLTLKIKQVFRKCQYARCTCGQVNKSCREKYNKLLEALANSEDILKGAGHGTFD